MKWFITLTCLLLTEIAWSQSALDELTTKQYTTNQQGMLILGSWALINLAAGGYGNLKTQGSTRYFHQMNWMWNSVNLGLATAGYLGSKSILASNSITEVLSTQMQFEKILLINAGLDVAYLMTGAFLIQKAKNSPHPDRLQGYGQSLLVQGSFLLIFDTLFYLAHHQQYPPILDRINQLSFAFDPSGGIVGAIGFTF